MKGDNHSLGLVRFMLVWSSLSPVFILWAIRGVETFEDRVFVPTCIALFIFPTFFLYVFYRIAKSKKNTKTIDIETSKDQREHLLVYLFAMLIPLLDANLESTRDFISISVALVFVMFLFWHMRLHYMNLIFAIFGYRIFTVEAYLGSAADDRSKGRLVTYAVISKRHHLPAGAPLTGLRLGGNVLVDGKQDD